MFVSLIVMALFAQALSAQVDNTVVNEMPDSNEFFDLMESGFKKENPALYQIIESTRLLLGIPKDKMMNFSMKALESLEKFQELWENLIDMFKKEEAPQHPMKVNYMIIHRRRMRRNISSH